ncbi:MAG: pitrilysin family protein [Planctomycetales bacterium]
MDWRWKGLCAMLVSGVAVSACAAAEADANARGIQKITEIEGISEYVLDNGLKVLLFPDDSQPTVTVNLTVFVGSRHEGYGEAGMAHLLEHMLFKGTPTHPQVPKALQERGARFNGTTWVDRTNYYETLPARGDNLEFAIRLEADRMVHSHVRKADLDSEMTVVRNEFEAGENRPASILYQRMLAAAYQWHNYGKATIGNRADIERVPIESLKDFYRRYYQPDNALLVVAGKFDPEQALALIAKHFGKIPRPQRELPRTYTEEPPQDGERLVTLRRVGDVAAAGAVYHMPSGAHPDYAALDVLESIFTASPSGRLYKALVETKRASSVSGAAFAWHDPGVMLFLAEVPTGNDPQVALDVMTDVIEKVGREGVTPEEVERARAKLLKQRELQAADATELAVDLSDWAAMGDWRLYFVYRDRLEKVTPEDVKQVAQKYLVRTNRTVGLYLPVKTPDRVAVPATPDLAEMIGDYQGREQVAAGEAFDVSPANVESRTKRIDIGDGVQAALLPRKTRGGMVFLRLTLRYGTAEGLRGKSKVAELLPTMMRRGTEKFTRQELQDALDRARAELTATGTPGEASFTLQVKRDRLPEALDLLEQVLRAPTFPESELEVLQRAQRATLEKQLTDPQSLAVNEVRRHLDPFEKGDPRYQPTPQEEIDELDAVTRDDVAELHRRFLGAGHATLAMVGDFDLDPTVARLEKMLGGWKSGEPYARLEHRVDPDAKGGTKTVLTPDKANAMYFAGLGVPMSDAHPDYPAVTLGNFVLGGGSLTSRLADRVRQQEGLSYGVASGFNARSLDDRAAFYLYAIYNPANRDRVEKAMREELERLLEEGVAQAELDQGREGWLERQSVSRSDDAGLAAILESTVETRRDMGYYARLEDGVRKLTPEEVLTAMRKHIDPRKLYVVTAGDFEKKAEPRPAP